MISPTDVDALDVLRVVNDFIVPCDNRGPANAGCHQAHPTGLQKLPCLQEDHCFRTRYKGMQVCGSIHLLDSLSAEDLSPSLKAFKVCLQALQLASLINRHKAQMSFRLV